MQADDHLAHLLARRTIHRFEPADPTRPIPDAWVEEAVEAARWAPNHRHTEPWRFHLLGPESQARVIELNAVILEELGRPEAAAKKRVRWATMPGWLLLTQELHEDPVVDRENYAACCCAAQNLQLQLWTRGVGLKWTTGPVTRDPRFFADLGLDVEACRVVGLFWYGWPAEVPDGHRELDVDRLLRRLD